MYLMAVDICDDNDKNMILLSYDVFNAFLFPIPRTNAN